MTVTSGTVLTDALLQRCRERAAGYDRENRFCQEDFDELKAAGYLNLTLPQEFGGLGYTLNQYTREARRLAQYAPATALCLNMHHYWVGTAADSWRAGDKSVRFILEDAGAGEVFAAGHAEHGNDIPGLLSTTKAEKVSGGYKFNRTYELTLSGRNITDAFQDYYSNTPGLLRSREILGPIWTLGVRGRF